MSKLIFHLGRKLGYATIPAIRKTRSAWETLTGTDAAAILAETEFGRAMAGALRLRVGVRHDAHDTELVRAVGDRLGRRIRNKLRRFRVDILRDGPPGAVALPGGFIFVSASLLDLCQRNPDELAFVIGHEMAHVLRQDAIDRVRAQIGAEGISAVLSRGLLSPSIGDLGTEWLLAAYAHDAEREADEFALRAGTAAGFNPTASLELLRKFSEFRASSRESGLYLASHPPETERIAWLQAMPRPRVQR